MIVRRSITVTVANKTNGRVNILPVAYTHQSLHNLCADDSAHSKGCHFRLMMHNAVHFINDTFPSGFAMSDVKQFREVMVWESAERDVSVTEVFVSGRCLLFVIHARWVQ